MNTLEAIAKVCNAFKEKEFEIEEFQRRLETIVVSDEYKQSLDKVRFDALNRLEEIRFCSLESNYRRYGEEVADALLSVANKKGK